MKLYRCQMCWAVFLVKYVETPPAEQGVEGGWWHAGCGGEIRPLEDEHQTADSERVAIPSPYSEQCAPGLPPDLTAALTPYEWGDCLTSYGLEPNPKCWKANARRAASDAAQEGRLHRAAALAPYGQPYGFTPEDVRMLRRLFTERWDLANAFGGNREAMMHRADAIADLADRIAGLLPPEPQERT
jgi:hypothetical protein